MVKEKILRKIKFPKVEFNDLVTLVDDLCKFYDAVRQYPDEVIDVRDIVINRDRAENILSQLQEKAATYDERVRVGLFWMNYGPSSSPDVPHNEVWVRGYEVC